MISPRNLEQYEEETQGRKDKFYNQDVNEVLTVLKYTRMMDN